MILRIRLKSYFLFLVIHATCLISQVSNNQRAPDPPTPDLDRVYEPKPNEHDKAKHPNRPPEKTETAAVDRGKEEHLNLAIEGIDTGEQHPIKIMADGVYPFKKTDVALILFMQVINMGSVPLQIDVKMHLCCLIVDEATNDVDCSSMHLLGGHRGQLMPHDRRNITMAYPNMYPYDRVGVCDIDTIYNDVAFIRHRLRFNSTQPSSAPWVPYFLRNYMKFDYITCDSIDEDRLRACRPVSCVLKYNGYRNFFNKTTRRCEPVPTCLSDAKSHLPDRGYDPNTNACIDMDRKLTADDMKILNETKESSYWKKVDISKMAKIKCVHGTLTNDDTNCECDQGWTSIPTARRAYNKKDKAFRMCNVRMESHFAQWHRRPLFLSMIVLAVVFIALILLSVYFTRKEAESDRNCCQRFYIWPQGSKGEKKVGKRLCFKIEGQVYERKSTDEPLASIAAGDDEEDEGDDESEEESENESAEAAAVHAYVTRRHGRYLSPQSSPPRSINDAARGDGSRGSAVSSSVRRSGRKSK